MVGKAACILLGPESYSGEKMGQALKGKEDKWKRG